MRASAVWLIIGKWINYACSDVRHLPIKLSVKQDILHELPWCAYCRSYYTPTNKEKRALCPISSTNCHPNCQLAARVLNRTTTSKGRAELHDTQTRPPSLENTLILWTFFLICNHRITQASIALPPLCVVCS